MKISPRPRPRPKGNLAAPKPAVFLEPAGILPDDLDPYELGYRAQAGESGPTVVSPFYNHYRQARSDTSTAPFIFPVVIHHYVEGETYGPELTASSQRLRLAEIATPGKDWTCR